MKRIAESQAEKASKRASTKTSQSEKASTNTSQVKPTGKIARTKSSAKSQMAEQSTTKKAKFVYTIPEQIKPNTLADYLEIMTMAAFQAGVSWSLVQSKWTNFRTAFSNFDPVKVAAYDQAKISALLEDTGILRSEKKIVGTINNAKMLLDLDSAYGTLETYLQSFTNYEALERDIKQRFHGIGDLSVYYFLFRVGQPVPDFDTWVATIAGDHPRMREMVARANMKRKTQKSRSKKTNS